MRKSRDRGAGLGDRPEIRGMTTIALRSAEHIAGWGLRMGWVLRLVGTGVDGQCRSFDVMEICRPDGLGDIANLGLTLAEGKQLLAGVQQGSEGPPVRKRTLRTDFSRLYFPF